MNFKNPTPLSDKNSNDNEKKNNLKKINLLEMINKNNIKIKTDDSENSILKLKDNLLG